MDKNIAIEFDGVGKQYRLGLVGTGSLQHDINRWWQTSILGKEDPYLKIGEVNDRSKKGHSDYVWALKDISFKVEQGDVVGIIGKNGAGKSTLLKLLSHITAPTVGHITYRGRIASLLEVGTGFHPEMTARDNIYMNGSIMGMSKHEIDRKLDEIVDFAGIERYIDTPVKRFSSGMTVRLGFAVAAFLEPEILVVDEVLAVGDAEFQKKAIGKMQEVSSGGGRTVLFVSHNMNAVKNLCKNGIVLNNGMIDFTGTAEECVEYYMETNISELVSSVTITPSMHHRAFTRELEYAKVEILNDVTRIATQEPIEFELKIKRNSMGIKKFQIGILINNTKGERVGVCYTKAIDIPNKDVFKIKVKLKEHQLAKGRYNVDFALSQFDYFAAFRDFDAVYDTVSFDITHLDCNYSTPFLIWPSQLGSCALQNAEVVLE